MPADRATKLEKLLKEAVPGTAVSVNPDKPRKGCFEVRGPGGKVFVSLLVRRTDPAGVSAMH